MFQYITFACLLAVAAAKPGNLITAPAPAVVSAYSSPVAYTSPLAYSAPLAYNGASIAYSGAPLTYSAAGAPLTYAAGAPITYAAAPYAAQYAAPLTYSTYNNGLVKPYSYIY